MKLLDVNGHVYVLLYFELCISNENQIGDNGNIHTQIFAMAHSIQSIFVVQLWKVVHGNKVRSFRVNKTFYCFTYILNHTQISLFIA